MLSATTDLSWDANSCLATQQGILLHAVTKYIHTTFLSLAPPAVLYFPPPKNHRLEQSVEVA